MMSKTHITIGIASSMAASLCFVTTGDILSTIIGGTTGGILCDIECRSTPQMRDALTGRIIALGVIGSGLLLDLFFQTGLLKDLISRENYIKWIGMIILLPTIIAGAVSKHRTFTHSLTFTLLITIGFSFLSIKLLIPVLIGALSHLFIDTFNYKPVPWLYPFIKKGVCFKLCYANKIGNKILMWVGFVFSILLLLYKIYLIIF